MEKSKDYNPAEILSRLREKRVLDEPLRYSSDNSKSKTATAYNWEESNIGINLPEAEKKQQPLGPATLQSIAELQFKLAKSNALAAQREIVIAQLTEENQTLKERLDREERDRANKHAYVSQHEVLLEEELKRLRKKVQTLEAQIQSSKENYGWRFRSRRESEFNEANSTANISMASTRTGLSYSSNREVEELFYDKRRNNSFDTGRSLRSSNDYSHQATAGSVISGRGNNFSKGYHSSSHSYNRLNRSEIIPRFKDYSTNHNVSENDDLQRFRNSFIRDDKRTTDPEWKTANSPLTYRSYFLGNSRSTGER